MFALHNPILILCDVFIASFFVGFTIPAINGAYADYISESSNVEKEIEALSDFSTNIGYVIGPIIAGFLADRVGNAQTFSILGLSGMIIAIILILKTPKSINIDIQIPD